MKGTIIIASLIILAAIGCHMTADRLAGVNARTNLRSDCVRECNDIYKAERIACGDDSTCRARAEQAMKDCKEGCYNEGSGNGGN